MVDEPATAEAEFLAEQAYDSSDPKQVNEARKKAGRERKEELEFIKAIMTVPAGRKWMHNFLTACKVFGNPVVPMDTHYTYFYLGMQNIGKKLLIDIDEAAPDEYTKMKKEARGRIK